MIDGPKTAYTDADGFQIGGAAVASAGIATSVASRCLTDVFSISNPGGPSPPQICGTVTDEHSKMISSKCKSLVLIRDP